MWFDNHIWLVVVCIWYDNVVGLVVGFGWIDNVDGFGNVMGLVVGRGFVVGRIITKIIDVGRSNTSSQTEIVSL